MRLTVYRERSQRYNHSTVDTALHESRQNIQAGCPTTQTSIELYEAIADLWSCCCYEFITSPHTHTHNSVHVKFYEYDVEVSHRRHVCHELPMFYEARYVRNVSYFFLRHYNYIYSEIYMYHKYIIYVVENRFSTKSPSLPTHTCFLHLCVRRCMPLV